MAWFQFFVVFALLLFLILDTAFLYLLLIFFAKSERMMPEKMFLKPRGKPPREKTRQEKALEDYQHNLVDFTFNDGKNQREIK